MWTLSQNIWICRHTGGSKLSSTFHSFLIREKRWFYVAISHRLHAVSAWYYSTELWHVDVAVPQWSHQQWLDAFSLDTQGRTTLAWHRVSIGRVTLSRIVKATQSMHTEYPLVCSINPLTAKLFYRDFHPLEVVSRWRDPQLQVSENYSDLTAVFKYCWFMSHFIFNMFKRWYLMC